jgi:hypothetical protein
MSGRMQLADAIVIAATLLLGLIGASIMVMNG